MYVVELDRAWLGTPFDFQGFPVTTEDQIDALRAHCASVYIDPEREHWTPDARLSHVQIQTPRAPAPPRPQPSPKPTAPLRGSVVYKEVTSVEKEVVVAREIYRSCEEALHQSLESLKFQGEIDS